MTSDRSKNVTGLQIAPKTILSTRKAIRPHCIKENKVMNIL